jgi:hypothetical protein
MDVFGHDFGDPAEGDERMPFGMVLPTAMSIRAALVGCETKLCHDAAPYIANLRRSSNIAEQDYLVDTSGHNSSSVAFEIRAHAPHFDLGIEGIANLRQILAGLKAFC